MASTHEKLITHVMKEEPVGSRNKVTVVGVGMVGMASAVSILIKVRRGAGQGHEEPLSAELWSGSLCKGVDLNGSVRS